MKDEKNKGVALSIDEQIDALENAHHELSRIMLSSGFNWHLIPECENVFPFDEFNDFYTKLYAIKNKLIEFKNERYNRNNNL
jgi:hypothetical protein